MTETHHRTAEVDGQRVFYREAGPADAPVVLLLHGYPTSSRMFRNLIPALADRYHVIAPDHIGFGRSATPPVSEFAYSFDALTDVTEALLDQLGVERFAMYVQDYGAPIGWRLALRRPTAVTAVISQNGNAYDEGFVGSFWSPLWAYAQAPGPDTEGPVRAALTLDAIRWQYLTGAPEPDLVDPDTWTTDHAEVNRPGNPEIQLALFRDYASNPPLYPAVHEYFRTSRVPLLAIWGRGDEIFDAAGATAFARDLPDAEIHLIDGSHFLLESALDTAVGYIRGFLGRTVGAPHR
ncbi:alpha/beta fold hydrolase [Pseudonocardia kunmingensis]|uniref:Pimeloyl-ACP methyl ester carboxylesterase n=1 Tax=Pseudonocardia kunmingensis TaxID=630975 RepID=A0A543DX01_9PSEU|nr:alpha/beta hydrolase [Pseudonocardia kunmingensis]TQM13845.1 pimeloyl-ACP methyl ester carboxylesterase [Pseudonocardia kunmingensis]